MSDDDIFHFPPEVAEDHVDELEPLMRDTINIARDDDDLKDLALPADELIATMPSGESFEALLSKYFPGGFDIG